jgi:hypothetical protein
MASYRRQDVNKIIGELKFNCDNICKLMDRLFDVAFDLQKDVEENAYQVKNPPQKKAPRQRKKKQQPPPTPDNSEETLDPPVADQELS